MEFFNTMREYLKDESRDKLNRDFDLDGWENYASPKNECPQQDNCCDCGVFTIRFAEFLSRRAPVTGFGQQHMPYFRERTAYELLTNELIADK